MTIKRLVASSFALTVLFCASLASAEEEGLTAIGRDDNALGEGAHSLSFAFPGGGNPYAGGAAGYWIMVTDQINLGLNLGLSLDPQEVGGNTRITPWQILLAPAIRYYMSTSKRFAPYLGGQLNLRLSSDGNTNTDERPELAIAGGIGVEYFLWRHMSLGGFVGLGIDLVRQRPKEPIGISTFTSALILSFYFK